MRAWLLVVFGILTSVIIVSSVIYSQKIAPFSRDRVIMTSPIPLSPFAASTPQSPSPNISQLPSPNPDLSSLPNAAQSPSLSNNLSPSLSANPAQVSMSPQPSSPPDLTVDASGLSKATVLLNTTQGLIKFKFYPNEAPKTVARIVELIQQGFYNGLSFHRVISGFVIQGGDPTGTGTGGSGHKLDAEFNQRRHIEGTVSMARSSDANSADSQFYITLGVHPHLDRNYTVFGQVIEGMDIAKKIKAGDKMTSVVIQ